MDAIGNVVDVSTMNMKLDFGPDFCLPEAEIVGRRKSFRRAENLAAISTNHAYAASGQYLSDLFIAQVELLKERKG
ncbi:MAG: hypothetical protein ABSD59_23000 [Terracidiphilus sp.]|jgi:hypothetical protein